MKHFVRTEGADKKGFTHYYSGFSNNEISEKTHEWFISKGYKLKEGESGNGTYEKGSRTARLLLGAFYKYFKWDVASEQHGAESFLEIQTSSSGMSGGMIGVNQVKKELASISNELIEL